jgi:hypothetical protein
MTTPYGTNPKRILLPLVAVLIGTLLTAFAFLLASSASGACHCSRPIALAFPYASIVWGTTKFEWLGGALMAIQFPVYSILIALAKSRVLRFRCALILFAIHIFAVVVALFVY